MTNDLINIILLLVIIWLVASIRQSILNTPGPVEKAKRVIRRAIGTEGTVATSRKRQPVDTHLVSLDRVNPDDAMDAINEYYEKSKGAK